MSWLKSEKLILVLPTDSLRILNSEFWGHHIYISLPPRSFLPGFARTKERPTTCPRRATKTASPEGRPVRGAIRSPPPPRASASPAPCGVPHNPCHFGPRFEDNVLQHVLNRFPAPTKQLRPGISPRDQSFACVCQPPTRRMSSRSPHNERDSAFFRSRSS